MHGDGDTELRTSQTESRHDTKQKTGLGGGSEGNGSGGKEGTRTREPQGHRPLGKPATFLITGRVTIVLHLGRPIRKKYYVSMTFL